MSIFSKSDKYKEKAQSDALTKVTAKDVKAAFQRAAQHDKPFAVVELDWDRNISEKSKAFSDFKQRMEDEGFPHDISVVDGNHLYFWAKDVKKENNPLRNIAFKLGAYQPSY